MSCNCFYCLVFSLRSLSRSKLNLGLLRVVEMSQRADTGGTGDNDQEETTASESSTQVKNLVANAVKECLTDITAGIAATVNDTIEGKFMPFKRQFIDESASSVESALNKVGRDPHQFNKKGHEQQFRHQRKPY